MRFQIPGAKTWLEYQAPHGFETGSISGPRRLCFSRSKYQAQKLDSSAKRRLKDPRKLARARSRGNPAFTIPDSRRNIGCRALSCQALSAGSGRFKLLFVNSAFNYKRLPKTKNNVFLNSDSDSKNQKPKTMFLSDSKNQKQCFSETIWSLFKKLHIVSKMLKVYSPAFRHSGIPASPIN